MRHCSISAAANIINMKALFLGVCFLALAGCSVASDAAVLLRGVSTEFKSSKISELQVGDLTTHLLHTTPLHVSADRTDFPEGRFSSPVCFQNKHTFLFRRLCQSVNCVLRDHEIGVSS